MTYLEVAFHYLSQPGEKELRALDSVREVYGIQRTQFNEKERIVRVLFDASRLNEDAVASLLRQAGLDLKDKPVLTYNVGFQTVGGVIARQEKLTSMALFPHPAPHPSVSI